MRFVTKFMNDVSCMFLFSLEIKISLAEFHFTFNIKWNYDFKASHV